MKSFKCAAGLAAIVLSMGAQAASVTIDFDDGSDGSAVGGFYSGVTFSSNTVWTTNFGLPGSTGSLGLGSSTGFWLYSYDASNGIRATFDNAVSSISIVGVDLGKNGLRIEGFDASNNSLGFADKFGTTDAGVGEFDTVSFSASGIKSVMFYQPVHQYGDGVVLDHMTYDAAAPVPEPETYALMLGGLGVLGFVARRRKPQA